ncbi:MAG: carbohydrate-binding family 9-like protein [Eubacteriales bacterium]|nr:carbohydrate-binding family 9-like protein [Eubacteriales bacterium]
MANNIIHCKNIETSKFPAAADKIWSNLESNELVDVQTGDKPFLTTTVRCFRDDTIQKLFFKFVGEDDNVLSYFRFKDEPLYKQDVFELFIADSLDTSKYIELEVSPHNVKFDGLISYSKNGERKLDMSFDILDWETFTVFDKKKSKTTSVWSIPYSAFKNPPKVGDRWRLNAFRIDHSIRGVSYQAWQKTGEINFHVPEAFGYLHFE